MMTAMPSPTPTVLTSRTNPRIVAVASLRDRRERDRTGLTVIDGAREVRRALESGAGVVEAFVCEPQLAGPEARGALDALVARGVSTSSVSEPVLEKIAFGDRADGIVAIVRVPDLALARLTLPPDPLVVVVEGVEKPGNLGAILRSADGAGVDALIAASPRTDLFNPNAIRASAGTIFRVPLAAAPSGEVLDWAQAGGLRLIAARVGAPRRYTDADLRGPIGLVVGAEAEGLTSVWADDLVEPVGIPMLGIADSLNVSVATAVLLYEARRQRERHAAHGG
jgi:RNA methyltransferase, TrmH family